MMTSKGQKRFQHLSDLNPTPTSPWKVSQSTRGKTKSCTSVPVQRIYLDIVRVAVLQINSIFSKRRKDTLECTWLPCTGLCQAVLGIGSVFLKGKIMLVYSYPCIFFEVKQIEVVRRTRYTMRTQRCEGNAPLTSLHPIWTRWLYFFLNVQNWGEGRMGRGKGSIGICLNIFSASGVNGHV